VLLWKQAIQLSLFAYFSEQCLVEILPSIYVILTGEQIFFSVVEYGENFPVGSDFALVQFSKIVSD
jgi:hypothetical protein